MNYIERRPSPPLRRHVECFWAVWDDEASAGREPERVVPDGCPEMILHLGDSFSRLNGEGRWAAQPRAFFAGTLAEPWLLRPGRWVKTLGIRFRPGAAASILDVRMEEAVGREIGICDVAGAAALELLESVHERPSIGDALAAADSWLVNLVRGRSIRSPSVKPALQLILSCRGRIRMEEATRSLGWSRRRLERAFQRDLGIAPKVFARIARLNSVLSSLDEAGRWSTLDLALECGYFDQSHLLRDFRELAGTTPGRLKAERGSLSRQLTRPERLRSLLCSEAASHLS